MKNVIVLCSFCYLLCFACLGQKVTYKDLVGSNWLLNDTSASQTMAFIFMDSTHLQLSFSAAEIFTNEKNIFTYSLDTSLESTLLHFEGLTKEKIRISNYFFIKLERTNILKIQGNWDGSKPIRWNDQETHKNTGVLSKTLLLY